MGNKKKAIRLIVVMFAVIAAAVLCLALIGCAAEPENNSETGAAEPNEITGITAEDVTAEYDGQYHGIRIEGTKDGDVIYYSPNGQDWQTEEITFVEKGEYKIYFKIAREGCEEYVGEAKLYIIAKILDGVTAQNAVIRFDGKNHGIKIDGLLPDDKVYYSTDGDNFKEQIEIKEVGEYIVYYKVVRGYAEYEDSVKIIIKENVLGTYLSSSGTIEITEENETEYSIDNGKITVNDIVYEKLNADEKVYKLNGEVYFKAQEECVVTVSFAADKATVTADGVKIKECEDVNYCESINGLKLERKNDNSDVTVNITHAEKVTDIEIILSKRRVNSIGEINQRKKYTGEAQTIDVEAGRTVSGALPKYTEPGVYTFTVYITEEGFLPEKVNVNFEIYNLEDGTYYNIEANGLIEIKDGTVTLNGEAVVEEVISSENAITINNIVYKKQGTNEKLCKMIIGEKIYIRLLDSYEYYITTEVTDNKTTVTVTDENGGIVLTEVVNSAAVSVMFNEKALEPIPDMGYIFSRSDYNKYAVSELIVR